MGYWGYKFCEKCKNLHPDFLFDKGMDFCEYCEKEVTV